MTSEQRKWFWKGFIVGRSKSTQQLRAMARQFSDECEVLHADISDARDELRRLQMIDDARAVLQSGRDFDAQLH